MINSMFEEAEIFQDFQDVMLGRRECGGGVVVWEEDVSRGNKNKTRCFCGCLGTEWKWKELWGLLPPGAPGIMFLPFGCAVELLGESRNHGLSITMNGGVWGRTVTGNSHEGRHLPHQAFFTDMLRL
ncbi:hypothetical protein IMZ48_13615 [Candidatus Bathyarchaeota archaeon]|nr:hypothetical protein [Candidatus Bathyarchaeota archaeon]